MYYVVYFAVTVRLFGTSCTDDRFKESFLWAAAKGGRVEECEMLLQMRTGKRRNTVYYSYMWVYSTKLQIPF